MAWQACGDPDLPLATRDREWDGAAASDHIFSWAGWDDQPDPEKAQRAFFAYDTSKADHKTGYKLPFADVIDGKLQAVPRGIFAVAQILGGARGGIDLPKTVQADVRRKVAAYYHKLGEQPPWEEE